MITQQFSYVATTIILYYLGKQRSIVSYGPFHMCV